MDADFWHRRWQSGDIGFHENSVNPMLAAHVGQLALADSARIFLPLCGKTRDIAWLRERGYRVVGVELSGLAIGELFEELGETPEVAEQGGWKHYRVEGIDIHEGDFFDLTAQRLGPVAAVYDRAALVALPAAMRVRYVAHLRRVTGTAPQLLITFEYDQTRLDGPPFSVDAAEVQALHGAHYTLASLAQTPVTGGLKGRVEAITRAWLLKCRP